MRPLDWALSLGLAGLTLATRLPFRARLLPSWDAVQFALAVGEYDIARHQPHPPGYILYVLVARGLAALTGDATAALTWLAVGASALTVVLVYDLGRRVYDRPTGLVAAAGLLVSPLFWAHGVMGLSYAAEAALATLVATLAWELRHGRPRAVVGAAVALALAGGVRQSILLVLLPLWLGMAWTGCRRWRPVAAGGAVLAGASVAWLVPMLVLAGGPGRYLEATRELYASTVRGTTVLGPSGGWLANLAGLGVATLLGVGVLLPVLGAVGWEALRRGRRAGPRTVFFALWIIPPLAVYAFVHLGQPGYLLTVLPAAYVLIARALTVARRRLVPPDCPPAFRWAPAAAVLASAVWAHTAFFVGGGPVDVPFPPAGAPWTERWTVGALALYRFQLWPSTAPGLREREAVIATYVEAVRREFRPADTVLVTEGGNPRSYPWFRHVMYYLPEFAVYHLRRGLDGGGYVAAQHAEAVATAGARRVVLPVAARRLVWVVDHWDPRLPPPPGLEARPLPHGRWLYVLRVGARPVAHAEYRLTPLTAVARAR